jgi:type I restriction enzyme M protein
MKKANYLWIQSVRSALKPGGRGAILLPNSAADAGASELVIRRKLIEAGEVEAVFNIGPNFYETGSNPVMLWLLRRPTGHVGAEPMVLFVDARQITTEVSRALNTWTPSQTEFLANVVRFYRGERPESQSGSQVPTAEHFPDNRYVDVAGLCRQATISEIGLHDWSLNPGTYVGIAAGESYDRDFAEKLSGLCDDFIRLGDEADLLRAKVNAAVHGILAT